MTLINGYGMTETMTLLCTSPVVGARRWPSIGLPAPGRRLRLVDDEGRDVAPGEVGEIVVVGVPGRDVVPRLLRRPRVDRRALLREDGLHTGDNAYADEQGFLYFFDRKKDMIKRAGENVSALEVEAVIATHPRSLDVAVVGVHDDIRDEAVAAAIVLAPCGRRDGRRDHRVVQRAPLEVQGPDDRHGGARTAEDIHRQGQEGRAPQAPHGGRHDVTQAWADLSPVSFLLRAARIFPQRVAIRDGGRVFTYAEYLARASALAGALAARGVAPGDRVAALLPNVPEMLEAHYAVAGSGAVLVPLNTRLSKPEIERILTHSEARVVVTDAAGADRLGDIEAEVLTTGDAYERALAESEPVALAAQEESALLSINYTSGTTGAPKGVMYTHRGAFLQSMGMIAETQLSPRSRYLWTLPMFHCHGWSFTWAVTAAGAENVCLPQVTGAAAWRLMNEHDVTHLCGAPTVLSTLLDADEAQRLDRAEPVRVYTGGAPPSPATIERCESLGWDVAHLYGLTETYGPIGVCVWHPEWDELPAPERARLKARQGVVSVVSQPLRVIDSDGVDVPADGATMGEIVMRGNNVTTGYFRDPEQTAKAMAGGWFHSGDVGVMHPDGYVEIRDRIKDIIISGGENISSIEVEQALAAHPAVAQVAVIGVAHEKWGETPHAFVVARPGATIDPDELRAFARERLAGYKLPSAITVTDELPTTATGKVQKMRLRELARTPV